MEKGAETTLNRFVDYLTRGFTPDLATHFSHLPKPDPEFQQRLDFLAEKATEGTLSSVEAQEYEKTVEYMGFTASPHKGECPHTLGARITKAFALG